MSRSLPVLVLLVGVGLCWLAEPTLAQPPLPIRDRPTLSPWLNLYRRDPGPIGPYLSYVRPEQRLLSRLSQQRTAQARQNAAIGALRGQLSELSQLGPETAIAPTGTGATFMNYSHFFGGTGGAVARSSGPSWTPPPPSRGGGYSMY